MKKKFQSKVIGSDPKKSSGWNSLEEEIIPVSSGLNVLMSIGKSNDNTDKV